MSNPIIQISNHVFEYWFKFVQNIIVYGSKIGLQNEKWKQLLLKICLIAHWMKNAKNSCYSCGWAMILEIGQGNLNVSVG